jgi:methionyl-tRNA synthetase
MSKSLGNVIDPVPLAAEYGNDVLRYFLLREIRVGEDGDFSKARLEQRYDGELASELGNLVHRVLTMTEKYFAGKVPSGGKGNKKMALGEDYFAAMDEFRLTDAIEAIWGIVRSANQYIEEKKPWELSKNGQEKVLAETMYNLLEGLRQVAWGLIPLMPETAEKIFQKLGLKPAKEMGQDLKKARRWGGLPAGTKTDKGEPLFPRRETA